MNAIPVSMSGDELVIRVPLSSLPEGTRELDLVSNGKSLLHLSFGPSPSQAELEDIEARRRAFDEFLALPSSPDWPDREQLPMQERGEW